MTFPPEVWDGVLYRLAEELPSFAFDSWLAPLVAVVDERGLALFSPNEFHRNRVRETLLPRISTLVGEAVSGPVRVRVEVGGDAKRRRQQCERLAARREASRGTANAAALDSPAREGRATPAGESPRTPAPHHRPPRSPEQQTFEQSFDNFVVGSANALAREAARAIADGRHAQLRQLYLHAAPGLGKTHLARAVVGESGRGARARYVHAERFTNEFMSAVRSKQMDGFKKRYRAGCDLLVVDDVHFLEGKVGTQIELFHTVQHLVDAGARVVATGSRPVAELRLLEAPLRSQLDSGFVACIEAPDAALRRSILRQKASAGGVRLPDDCLDLMVERLRGSVRDLDGALVQLVTTSSLLKRPIDLALTREVLTAKGAIDGDAQSRPRPEQVVEVVARFFKTTPEALSSRSRRRDILVPRQLAMYLARRFTDATLRQIGEALGREEPAVRNAIRRVERDAVERAPARYQLEAVSERVRERLGAGAATRP